MKPMLAVNCDLAALRFPLIASPKLDGIRALNVGGKLLSRKFIEIPNKSTRAKFGGAALEGLDGELIVGSPAGTGVLNRTSSGVSREHGEPDVKFYVFDVHNAPSGESFHLRLKRVEALAKKHPDVVVVLQHVVNNLDELNEFEARAVEMGFEGVILRHPDGPYKFGRSTLNEGYMLKMKRWEDREAEIIGVVEEMHNGNTAGTDNLGRTKRSTAQAGKSGNGTLGSFKMRDLESGVEFDCNTGPLSAVERERLWAKREKLVGLFGKYKSVIYGVKDKPRFAQFIAFRERWDF